MAKYDMTLLTKRIEEKFPSNQAFADAAKLNRSTVSRLLQRGDWRASQMFPAAEVLGIPDEQIRTFFYASSGAKTHGDKK